MKMTQILVSDKSYNSNDPKDILFSNTSVMNVLRTESVGYDQIHQAALESYFVDFFLTQLNKGGFAQYVFTSRWYPALITYLEKGLTNIKAEQFLDYFSKQKTLVEGLTKEELDGFLNMPPHIESHVKDKLNKLDYKTINEDLVALNADWLKNHPDLKVVPHDSLYFEIEKAIGKTPNF